MKRIAFITDIHLGEQFPIDNNVNPPKNLETVLSDIENRKINEIIFGGDIGEATSHDYFFEKLKNLNVKLILGNHDKFDKVKDHFNKDKNKDELYYKTEDETYQYIFLDSSSDELSKTQLEWILNELSEQKELVLFVHHPVLEIETKVDKVYPLKNRDELKLILLKFKNNVTIFCGHYHMNDEQEFKNIKQYTTQSLSFQLIINPTEIEIDNLNFGYRIITISTENIKTEIINFKQ
ncbi:MAG: metallophosphoesterase family protein [Bacteroidia bacterium]|nr:metallophosphoesterase family protein [Bacteroidia bacterium]